MAVPARRPKAATAPTRPKKPQPGRHRRVSPFRPGNPTRSPCPFASKFSVHKLGPQERARRVGGSRRGEDRDHIDIAPIAAIGPSRTIPGDLGPSRHRQIRLPAEPAVGRGIRRAAQRSPSAACGRRPAIGARSGRAAVRPSHSSAACRAPFGAGFSSPRSRTVLAGRSCQSPSIRRPRRPLLAAPLGQQEAHRTIDAVEPLEPPQDEGRFGLILRLQIRPVGVRPSRKLGRPSDKLTRSAESIGSRAGRRRPKSPVAAKRTSHTGLPIRRRPTGRFEGDPAKAMRRAGMGWNMVPRYFPTEPESIPAA